jgi:hypothetical protein
MADKERAGQFPVLLARHGRMRRFMLRQTPSVCNQTPSPYHKHGSIGESQTRTSKPSIRRCERMTPTLLCPPRRASPFATRFTWWTACCPAQQLSARLGGLLGSPSGIATRARIPDWPAGMGRSAFGLNVLRKKKRMELCVFISLYLHLRGEAGFLARYRGVPAPARGRWRKKNRQRVWSPRCIPSCAG